MIRERFFSIGDDFDITDDGRAGRLPRRRQGVHPSQPAGDRGPRRPRGGRRRETPRRLRPTYAITIGGEKAADVRKHFFTPFRDRFTIDIPGPGDLEVTGDLLDHEFTIERDGEEVARVSKRWFSLRDTYGVQVSQGEDDLLVLASVLAVDLALARERGADGD